MSECTQHDVPKTDRIHFMSVWWSNIQILESDGHFAFVDTGLPGDYPRIAAYLEYLGVKELDFILVSHFHNDHFGSCAELVRHFPTKTVYFKPYSNVEHVSGGGTEMSAEGRAAIKNEYLQLLDTLREYSEVVLIYPEMPPLMLGSMRCMVYNADNILQKMYTDETSEYAHRYVFNENNNSAMVYVESKNGASALLTSDCYNEPLTYLPGRHVICRTAKNIGHKIDVYTLAHHGCGEFTTQETAQLLCPDIVFTTGGEDDMLHSQNYQYLHAANPNAKFYATQGYTFVVHMDGPGQTYVPREKEIPPKEGQ